MILFLRHYQFVISIEKGIEFLMSDSFITSTARGTAVSTFFNWKWELETIMDRITYYTQFK
jgi:hypothetical protein